MFRYRLQWSREEISQATGNFSKSSGRTTLPQQKVQEKMQESLLWTVMGQDCLKVLKSINLSSTESEDSKACLKGLDNYFKPVKNEVYERFIRVLYVRSRSNELVDRWLTRLRHLSWSCNFGETLDSMLRDRLTLETKDKKSTRSFV